MTLTTKAMEEIWRPIENTLGLYEISSHGRVASYRKGGRKIMNPCKYSTGYLYVQMYLRHIGKGDPREAVHRLVAKSFLPNPENKAHVNHIDGNPLNNNLSNLEWATPKENSKHAFETGLFDPGRKLSTEDVLSIRSQWSKGGITQTELAKRYSVNHTTISAIVHGKSYKSI